MKSVCLAVVVLAIGAVAQSFLGVHAVLKAAVTQTKATVVLACSPDGYNHNGSGIEGYGVTYVSSSDSATTLPTVGQPNATDGNAYDAGTQCGPALQLLYSQGFAPQSGISQGAPIIGNNSPRAIVLTYTLTRGEGVYGSVNFAPCLTA